MEHKLTEYAGFKVLVDEPSIRPGLGFEYYSSALADVIKASKPQFAIGIFGGWGSGKTTLMRAIFDELAHEQHVIPVWFNAWRYEREPHLIIPLLDVLRETLQMRAVRDAEDPNGRIKRMATAAGRAAKAILRSTTLTGSFFGAGAELDIAQMIAELSSGDNGAEDAPVSLYHAAFNTLKSAADGFSQDGEGRIVVFIDDLDRCMPQNALALLESMKLFFDLEGFVFVAGSTGA